MNTPDVSNNKESTKLIKQREIIKLVCRQTDYTNEIAKEHLEKNNYNYLKVIKNYMNPTPQQPKTPTINKSVNQKIYTELRNFMDYGCRQYELKKQLNKKRQRILNEANKQNITSSDTLTNMKINKSN